MLPAPKFLNNILKHQFELLPDIKWEVKHFINFRSVIDFPTHFPLKLETVSRLPLQQ